MTSYSAGARGRLKTRARALSPQATANPRTGNTITLGLRSTLLLYIYIYYSILHTLCTCLWGCNALSQRGIGQRGLPTANPRTERGNLHLRGLDSSGCLVAGGGIPRSVGNFPEIQTQRFLACEFSVCGLAVLPIRDVRVGNRWSACARAIGDSYMSRLRTPLVKKTKIKIKPTINDE